MKPTPCYHPQADDDGAHRIIKHPSVPTAAASWLAPDQLATVIPLGAMPAALNNIALAAWTPPTSDAGWNELAARTVIDEPPYPAHPHKSAAAGVVIEESDGRIWVVAPSNGFAGYQATYPKGRLDQGVSLQATAMREAYEESGLQVVLTAFLIDSERSQTLTRYYLGRRIGGTPAQMGWETQAVHLVPLKQLTSVASHANDGPVNAALMAQLQARRA